MLASTSQDIAYSHTMSQLQYEVLCTSSTCRTPVLVLEWRLRIECELAQFLTDIPSTKPQRFHANQSISSKFGCGFDFDREIERDFGFVIEGRTGNRTLDELPCVFSSSSSAFKSWARGGEAESIIIPSELGDFSLFGWLQWLLDFVDCKRDSFLSFSESCDWDKRRASSNCANISLWNFILRLVRSGTPELEFSLAGSALLFRCFPSSALKAWDLRRLGSRVLSSQF